MFYDAFKEGMARNYSQNYDSDTSFQDSESEEERNEVDKGKEIKNHEMSSFVRKTVSGLRTHITKKHKKL